MSTIRFPTFVANMINGSATGCLVSSSTASTSQSIISGSQASAVSLLLIYKGTIGSFPSLTDRSTRDSDLLITFTLSGVASFDDLGVVNNSFRYTFGKHLNTQTASASGVASWFILCRSGTSSMTDKGALIGSIGTTNSGADLEIPDTNIVSGNSYTSAGFFVNFPQSWTF